MSEDGEPVEKKRPGRPRIKPLPDPNTPKKKRGRPRIHPITPKIPKKRGRPPKSSYIPPSSDEINSSLQINKEVPSLEGKEISMPIKEVHSNISSLNSSPKALSPLTPLSPSQNGNNYTNGFPLVDCQ